MLAETSDPTATVRRMTIEWLPDLAAWRPSDWQAASGFGTLLVAATATLIARRQLIQARELREEEAAPFIVVDIVPDRPGGWLLDLVIENTGKTMARDVRITFEPPIQTAIDMKGYEPQNWSPLRDGIKTLIPSRRLHSLFDSAHERYPTDLPRQYEVNVDCKDARGRPQPTVTITIDLEPTFGAMTSREKGLDHLVQEVEKLRKASEKIAKKVGTVEVFDGPARQAERAERQAEWQRSVRRMDEQQGLPYSEPDPDAEEDENDATAPPPSDSQEDRADEPGAGELTG